MTQKQDSAGKSFANGNAPVTGPLSRGLYGEQVNDLWNGCSAPGR